MQVFYLGLNIGLIFFDLGSEGLGLGTKFVETQCGHSCLVLFYELDKWLNGAQILFGFVADKNF